MEGSNQKSREKVGTRREGWNQKGMLEPGGKGWILEGRLEPRGKAGTWRKERRLEPGEKVGTRKGRVDPGGIAESNLTWSWGGEGTQKAGTRRELRASQTSPGVGVAAGLSLESALQSSSPIQDLIRTPGGISSSSPPRTRPRRSFRPRW